MLPSMPLLPSRRLLPALAAVLVALIAGPACATEVASQEPAPAGSAQAEQADEVLAVVAGEPITFADLREQVGMELDQLEFQYRSQRHQLLEQALEQTVRERLLSSEAEARGMTVEDLLAAEIETAEVSDAQVVAFYETNQARLQGRALAELRPAIRQFLQDQQREQAVTALTERIAEERAVERRLEPFRVDLETEGHPSMGPADAAVTLVEFSDFECPYCGTFFATLERIEEEYGDRIRIVYRQFPLRQIHPNAQKAAEASLCAEEQGKFWELHDLMFQEQDSLDVASLEDKAARLGMDTEAFASCLASGRHAEQVQEDVDAGASIGVTGTPALFVNGRPVEGGAVPFEAVAEIIEQELERAGER